MLYSTLNGKAIIETGTAMIAGVITILRFVRNMLLSGAVLFFLFLFFVLNTRMVQMNSNRTTFCLLTRCRPCHAGMKRWGNVNCLKRHTALIGSPCPMYCHRPRHNCAAIYSKLSFYNWRFRLEKILGPGRRRPIPVHLMPKLRFVVLRQV